MAYPETEDRIDRPGPAVLLCPHHGCRGAFVEPSASRELLACPTCRRAVARCPRVGGDGRRCRALNRPLSRYCRYCGRPLGPDWASALWGGDRRFAARRGGAVADPDEVLTLVEAAEPVLRVADHLPPGAARRNLTLLEAAGRVWIGSAEGVGLFLEPFAAEGAGARARVERVGPSAGGRALPGGRVVGTWLLLHTPTGLDAVDLLGLDDPLGGGPGPLEIWRAGPSEACVAEPVPLGGAGPGGGPPAVAWLADGPAGLVLGRASLPSEFGGAPAVERRVLPGGVDGPMVPTGERAALVPVPTADGPEALVLVTPSALWRVDWPSGGEPAVRPLERKPPYHVGRGDLHGVAFIPANPAEDGRLGKLFLARGEPGRAVEAIRVLTLWDDGPPSALDYREHAGVPIGVADAAAGRGVLALCGRALVFCDYHLPQQRVLAEDESLRRARRAHVYGRVALISGVEDIGTGERWFVRVIDLMARPSAGVVRALDWDRRIAYPTMLGPYLFLVEDLPGPDGDPEPHLTRRRLCRAGVAGDEWAETPAAPPGFDEIEAGSGSGSGSGPDPDPDPDSDAEAEADAGAGSGDGPGWYGPADGDDGLVPGPGEDLPWMDEG